MVGGVVTFADWLVGYGVFAVYSALVIARVTEPTLPVPWRVPQWVAAALWGLVWPVIFPWGAVLAVQAVREGARQRRSISADGGKEGEP